MATVVSVVFELFLGTGQTGVIGLEWYFRAGRSQGVWPVSDLQMWGS